MLETFLNDACCAEKTGKGWRDELQDNFEVYDIYSALQIHGQWFKNKLNIDSNFCGSSKNHFDCLLYIKELQTIYTRLLLLWNESENEKKELKLRCNKSQNENEQLRAEVKKLRSSVGAAIIPQCDMSTSPYLVS